MSYYVRAKMEMGALEKQVVLLTSMAPAPLSPSGHTHRLQDMNRFFRGYCFYHCVFHTHSIGTAALRTTLWAVDLWLILVES